MVEFLLLLEVLRAFNLAMEIAVSLLELQRKRKNAMEREFQCACSISKNKTNLLND